MIVTRLVEVRFREWVSDFHHGKRHGFMARSSRLGNRSTRTYSKTLVVTKSEKGYVKAEVF